MPLQKEFLDILACPKCKSNLEENGMFVICNSCKLAFPILDNDIPDLLVEDAWKLDQAQKVKFIHELKL